MPATAGSCELLDEVIDYFNQGVASLQAHREYLTGLGEHGMADPRQFLESMAGPTGSVLAESADPGLRTGSSNLRRSANRGIAGFREWPSVELPVSRPAPTQIQKLLRMG